MRQRGRGRWTGGERRGEKKEKRRGEKKSDTHTEFVLGSQVLILMGENIKHY
jgi:hypothetical protein